jgi:hypothetical protein
VAADNPQTINEEAGLGPNWKPIDAPPITGRPSPPSVGDITPVIPQYFQGSLDPSVQHDADFVNTALRSSSAPRFALMPPGLQSVALTSSQIVSVAKTAASAGTGPGQGGTGGSGGGGGGSDSDQITLDAPIEFTLTTQTVTLPGPFVLAWATEPAGFEFAVPNGSVGFDGANAVSTNGASSVSVTSPVPSTSPEWALYLGGVITGNFASAPASGWTALPLNNIPNFPIYTKAVPSGGTVTATTSVTAPTDSPEVAAILLFSGTAINVIQSGEAFDVGTGTMTVTLTNPTTAGSFILAIYQLSSATAGSLSPGTITDTQHLTQSQLLYVVNQGVPGHETVGLQVVLLSTCTNTSESVTLSYSRINGGNFVVYEISGLNSIASVPRFMPEAPVDLSTAVNVLSVINGGTGANLNGTGGTSNVLIQNILGGPITVRRLDFGDLAGITLPAKYNSVLTAGRAMPSIIAVLDTTATADITLSSLTSTTSGGLYRISFYCIVVTPATTSTLPTLNLQWVDADNGVTQIASYSAPIPTGNSTTTVFYGTQIVSAQASSFFQYSTSGYASSGGGGMVYALHLRLEAI